MLPVLARTPTELAASTAALSTVKTLNQAIGGVLGGLLLIVSSPAVVFGGASIVFFAAAAIIWRFNSLAVAVSRNSRGGIRYVTRDTLSLLGHSHVAGIVIVSGLRTFVRGMWIATAVIASLRLLHAGSAGVGLLMLAAGIGSLAAVPLSATLIGRSRLGNPAAMALIACGIPLGLIAGVPVLDVALVLVAAWGVGMAVADVTTLSLLYRLLGTPALPRATATIEAFKLAMEGIGALIAPILVIEIGARGALLVAASPLPIVVLAGWRTLHRVDVAASERSRVLGLLHGVTCLRSLDMAALDALAACFVRSAVSEGTELIRQGDHGDHFYVVESGSADVLVDGFYVGEVGAGDSFGEKALLRDVTRTATVRAREPMQLLALTREDFLSGLTGQKESAAVLSKPAPTAARILSWTPRVRCQRSFTGQPFFSHRLQLFERPRRARQLWSNAPRAQP